jgi:4-amino-4-deoxy-L-arabinose transferase-like glycosyltransferase
VAVVVADEAATTPSGGEDAAAADAPDPEPAPSADDGQTPTGRPPRIVWLATLLLGLVAALWTVAVPAYRAPDEAAHLDLIVYLAEGHPYPDYDGRFFGNEVGLDTDRYLIVLTQPWPRFDAADAPPRDDRPDVDDLGGTKPDKGARRYDKTRAGYPYVYNQMPQHPPLYYLAMSSVLRAERALLPGDSLTSLDRELGLLRLANVLLITPLPLLAWATVRRLGVVDRRAGAVAALLPLCLPQFTHIGAAVNNDNLFTLLGAVLGWLLVGVGRGRRTWRTDVAVGVVLGLALLTKAFALMFVPWVVAAYLLCAWTTRRWRATALMALLAGGVGALVGAWWWIDNWIRYDQPAPTTESLTRTVQQRPPGFSADRVEFLWTFSGRMISHTWAWIGMGTPKFELPRSVVMSLTEAALAAIVVAVWTARRGLSPERGLRRWDAVLVSVPMVLVTLFVARRAWGLYGTTGKFAFIQGRYLFGSLLGVVALVGIGASRALGRWTIAVTLALAAVLQIWLLSDVMEGSWSGPGEFGPVHGALAWSPWPAAIVVLVVAAALATTAWIALEARRL